MTIQLNGQPADLTDASLLALLRERQVDPDHVVVEINRAILERECFADTVLQPGDEVEILRFVGGG